MKIDKVKNIDPIGNKLKFKLDEDPVHLPGMLLAEAMAEQSNG